MWKMATAMVKAWKQESGCFHCLLPTAHCPLPTAPCLVPTAHCLLPTAHCLVPTWKQESGCMYLTLQWPSGALHAWKTLWPPPLAPLLFIQSSTWLWG